MSKYGALSFVAVLMRVFGVILVAISCIMIAGGIMSIITATSTDDPVGHIMAVTGGGWAMAGGVGLLLYGLMMITLGQFARVVMDTAKNSQQTAENTALLVGYFARYAPQPPQ